MSIYNTGNGQNTGGPTFNAAIRQATNESRRSIPLHAQDNDNAEQDFLFDGSAAVNPDLFRSTQVTDAAPAKSRH